MDFFGAQTLCIHETTKVIVVRKDKNLMFAACHVVALYSENFNDSQKITIMGLVLYFRWNYFAWKECY